MNVITVEQQGDKFVAKFAFDWDTKDLVKRAGFRFDPKTKIWWTKEKTVADRVRSPEAIKAWIEGEKLEVVASAATDADIEIPAPDGLSYLGYQKAGIAYAMRRDAVLIGDEMGLGKTIQAIGIANADPSIRRVLVICPASLKTNWLREWRKWDVKKLSTTVVNGKWDDAEVVIINYDIVSKYRAAIEAIDWDLVILDECHYLKNARAHRTKAILGYYDKEKKKHFPGVISHARRKVFLTGTPIVNRPIELWTLLQVIDPEGLGKSFFGFTNRYCNAHHNGYGWDFNGASNLDELQQKLRKSCMVRRLKADVLKELPLKRRSVIVLTPTREQRKLISLEKQFLGEDYEQAISALEGGIHADIGEISRIRQDLAVSKVDQVVDHVKALLEETGKVVVMAHHYKVIDEIAKAFGEEAVVFDGRMNQNDRQESVDRFQNDPSVKVFVGSIKAAGVGITLTAASTVVFAELDWTPGGMSQAEDRCHRIGQKDMVNVYHVVLDDSLDAGIAKMLVEKQAVIDKALDEKVEDKSTDLTFNEVSEKEKVEEKDSTAPAYTEDQIEAVKTALRRLAGVCDYALQNDGVGFNATDAVFGHSLSAQETLTPKQVQAAMRMLKKYRRQLGEDLMNRIYLK